MNALVVGTDKTYFQSVSGNFLFIDGGPLIEELSIPQRKKVVRFDVKKHHFNPLHKLDYKRARDFVSVIDAVFPEGADTLTKKNANFILLEALLGESEYLNTLIEQPDKKDTARQDAYQKIQTLMFSPVLSAVLCKPINFSLRGIVLARLDRSVLGDFDAFVLGNLLISQFKGQVVVPDFGFYGREHHIGLIRQGRLIAGVNTLGELSDGLRRALLGIPDKVAATALPEDAEVLAQHRAWCREPSSTGISLLRRLDRARPHFNHPAKGLPIIFYGLSGLRSVFVVWPPPRLPGFCPDEPDTACRNRKAARHDACPARPD
jgi:hypothetical protein